MKVHFAITNHLDDICLQIQLSERLCMIKSGVDVSGVFEFN